MDRDSNDARALRAMVEHLRIIAERYDQTGQLNCRDRVNDAAEAVGALLALPDADDDGDDIDN